MRIERQANQVAIPRDQSSAMTEADKLRLLYTQLFEPPPSGTTNRFLAFLIRLYHKYIHPRPSQGQQAILQRAQAHCSHLLLNFYLEAHRKTYQAVSAVLNLEQVATGFAHEQKIESVEADEQKIESVKANEIDVFDEVIEAFGKLAVDIEQCNPQAVGRTAFARARYQRQLQAMSAWAKYFYQIDRDLGERLLSRGQQLLCAEIANKPDIKTLYKRLKQLGKTQTKFSKSWLDNRYWQWTAQNDTSDLKACGDWIYQEHHAYYQQLRAKRDNWVESTLSVWIEYQWRTDQAMLEDKQRVIDKIRFCQAQLSYYQGWGSAKIKNRCAEIRAALKATITAQWQQQKVAYQQQIQQPLRMYYSQGAWLEKTQTVAVPALQADKAHLLREMKEAGRVFTPIKRAQAAWRQESTLLDEIDSALKQIIAAAASQWCAAIQNVADKQPAPQDNKYDANEVDYAYQIRYVKAQAIQTIAEAFPEQGQVALPPIIAAMVQQVDEQIKQMQSTAKRYQDWWPDCLSALSLTQHVSPASVQSALAWQTWLQDKITQGETYAERQLAQHLHNHLTVKLARVSDAQAVALRWLDTQKEERRLIVAQPETTITPETEKTAQVYGYLKDYLSGCVNHLKGQSDNDIRTKSWRRIQRFCHPNNPTLIRARQRGQPDTAIVELAQEAVKLMGKWEEALQHISWAYMTKSAAQVRTKKQAKYGQGLITQETYKKLSCFDIQKNYCCVIAKVISHWVECLARTQDTIRAGARVPYQNHILIMLRTDDSKRGAAQDWPGVSEDDERDRARIAQGGAWSVCLEIAQMISCDTDRLQAQGAQLEEKDRQIEEKDRQVEEKDRQLEARNAELVALRAHYAQLKQARQSANKPAQPLPAMGNQYGTNR